jgi:hypothetical protein
MTISITSPTTDQQVSGTITIEGTSSQTVLNSELTAQPFSVSYDTSGLIGKSVLDVPNSSGAHAYVEVIANVSADGATLPPATQLADADGVVWEVVSGTVYKDGVGRRATALLQRSHLLQEFHGGLGCLERYELDRTRRRPESTRGH